MDLGQAMRPRQPVAEFDDFTPRKKCTICCGLHCAAVAGFAVFLVTLPCNAVMLGGRVCEGKGLRGFLNRNLFLPLPIAAITLTHQIILSESLWGKNKKTVWEINTQSALTNITLWTVMTAACTALSRKYLPTHSRTYRLLLWDYKRTRRGCANRWMPNPFGRITEDLDWYNIMWSVSVYHILWGMVTVMLEKKMGAHYGMLFKDWSYSRWCSPRWREWRELEVERKLMPDHTVVPNRWGSFLTNDKWRMRNN